MFARIPSPPKYSAVALLIIAIAVPAMAGPLPLPVLNDMRARTVSSINDAEARIQRLTARIANATEQFNRQTDPGNLLPAGAYEQLLGNYGQELAELSAQVTGQQTFVASLSNHLHSIDEQIRSWRVINASADQLPVAKLPQVNDGPVLQPGTGQGTGSSNWLNAMILQFQSEPVMTPARSIRQYTYRDQIVYYVPAPCCDQLSTLYDANGRVMCSPDGGFAGGGDGRCLDFFEERTGELLIWADSRS